MTKIHEGARAWELALAEQFGRAMVRRRKALGISATQLWNRTNELGYPVTRVAISKIENNTRNGKLDVAEVMVLAAALEIPPMLLLYPEYPAGEVEVLPGRVCAARDAALWLSGESELPVQGGENTPPSAGVAFVQGVGELWDMEWAAERRQPTLTQRADQGEANAAQLLKLYAREIHYLMARIESARADLWGADGA